MSRLQRLSERDIRAVIAQKGRQRERWLKSAHLPIARVRSAVARAGDQVHGIGVGRKIVARKATNSACIRFYVTHKLPKSLIGHEQLIPTHIDGIPTDVIEAPVAYFADNSAPPACSAERLSRQRPIC